MSKREALSRYNLIIKKLRNCPSDFNEIISYLEFESDLQNYNFVISKRTFLRDLDDIRSLYNIDIQYDFSRRKYFIDTADQPEVQNKILETFDLFNALNISERIADSIHFEKRESKGTENINGMLHAIKNKLQISFNHKKYYSDKETKRLLEPYALKEYKNRWYILGKDQKDMRIKNFALDRISEFEVKRVKFKLPPDFSVNKYYEHSFGVIVNNEKEVSEIVLSFTHIQGKYIKSMPLHHTQEILVDNSDELRIKLKMFITHDFVMELLSHSYKVKVIAPQSLCDELKRNYMKALNNYE
ncbi:MAG: WYL domain-containing protein [Bacteroidales bacterium]|nr:WYL domain-containing protein [Bacteroidales bacterium]